MNLLGLDASISFAGYGQILQEALDPSSVSGFLAAGGFNLFLVRPGDLSDNDAADVVKEITDALAGLSARSGATQILVFCPGTVSNDTIEDAAVESLSGIANVEVIPSRTLAEHYLVSDPFDPEAERSGKIPFTEPMFAALATMLARRISLRTRPPEKVLVLDADNTLWGGIAGEDGPAALRMDGPWKTLREFALTKREGGLLLCLCSKN